MTDIETETETERQGQGQRVSERGGWGGGGVRMSTGQSRLTPQRPCECCCDTDTLAGFNTSRLALSSALPVC